jgi:hypothetical protein
LVGRSKNIDSAGICLVTIEMVEASRLLSAEAVRSRAHRVLQIGLEDGLPSFRIDLGRLEDAVDLVLAMTRSEYPTFEIPFHSRWRHFVVGGTDRWAALAEATEWRDEKARARAEFDLAIVSVLLDAGAGPSWNYRDAVTGERIGRSEGLALAGLDMFMHGAFSADPGDPLRVDAKALARISIDDISDGFQVTDDNPLVGVAGRVGLLRRLGSQISAAPGVFASIDTPRPGGLFDHLAGIAHQGSIAAPEILSEILRQLGPIWPSRLTLGGVPLGDCWHYPPLKSQEPDSDLVPLHKLSQWLSYSLIEPLERTGIAVTDIDGLTGLAEYRNGGLFVDTGVLKFRDPADAAREHEVSSPLVVEWRALTVALLDRLADSVRQSVGLDATLLPLAKILQGGTWAAGRAIARKRRAGGSPPVKVISDGTVF